MDSLLVKHRTQNPAHAGANPASPYGVNMSCESIYIKKIHAAMHLTDGGPSVAWIGHCGVRARGGLQKLYLDLSQEPQSCETIQLKDTGSEQYEYMIG